MLVEDVDFTARDNPYLVGRKALAVSMSDIASCGGVPRYCVVSMGIPASLLAKYAERIFCGMHDLARNYHTNIVGGDLSRSRKIVIDVSMLGLVRKKHLVLRSGAKPKDIIFVTGALGGSIYGKHLRFTPRLEAAQYLVKNFKINAMIDISDGLVQDLGHILRQSNVGAVLFEKLIPLAKKARGLDDSLFMGEDFELLFTASPPQAKRLLAKAAKFIPIGQTMESGYGLRLLGPDGNQRPIKKKGFCHF